MSRSRPADSAVTADDVQQGRILWLPSFSEVSRSSSRRGSPAHVVDVATGERVPAELYNHPILVLSRPADNPESIYFHLLTSFHGESLRESRRPNLWHNYVPLDRTPAHPSAANNRSYRNLEFAQDAHMTRDNYIKVGQVYRMDWQDAARQRGANPSVRQVLGLTEESLRRVLSLTRRLCRFSPGEQFDASEVATTAHNSFEMIETDTIGRDTTSHGFHTHTSRSALSALRAEIQPSDVTPTESDHNTNVATIQKLFEAYVPPWLIRALRQVLLWGSER